MNESVTPAKKRCEELDSQGSYWRNLLQQASVDLGYEVTQLARLLGFDLRNELERDFDGIA